MGLVQHRTALAQRGDVDEADRFSGVPPPGPAMPVTATASCALELATAPSAMARATLSDTAPSVSISFAGTPSMSDLARIGIDDEAALEHIRRAGDFGQQSADQSAGAAFGGGDAQAARARIGENLFGEGEERGREHRRQITPVA